MAGVQAKSRQSTHTCRTDFEVVSDMGINVRVSVWSSRSVNDRRFAPVADAIGLAADQQVQPQVERIRVVPGIRRNVLPRAELFAPDIRELNSAINRHAQHHNGRPVGSYFKILAGFARTVRLNYLLFVLSGIKEAADSETRTYGVCSDLKLAI